MERLERLKKWLATGAGAAIAAAGLILGAPHASAQSANLKQIPVRRIPAKTIPGKIRRRQGRAFSGRQKRNRLLVHKARTDKKRRLKRTGTAYEKDFR